MNVSVTVDGIEVAMTPELAGYRGVIELDGVFHIVHTTVTRSGPPGVSPAKARLRRYVNGVEQDVV